MIDCPGLLSDGTQSIHEIERAVSWPWQTARSIAAYLGQSGGDILFILPPGIQDHSVIVLAKCLAREAADHTRPFRVNVLRDSKAAGEDPIDKIVAFFQSGSGDLVTGTVLDLDGSIGVRSVAGKSVLITGATDGIGFASAEDLALRGARVVITGRREKEGRQAEARLMSAGLDVQYRKMDAALGDEWQATIEAIEESHGSISYIVSNVGRCILSPITHFTDDQFSEMLRANVSNSFFALEYGLPAIKRAGGGGLLAVSSIAALCPSSHSTAYSATKAAIADLVNAASARLSGQVGISLNTLYPGLVWGGAVAAKLGSDAAEQLYEKSIEKTPLKCLATASDVAGVVSGLLERRMPVSASSPVIVDGGYAI
jgi:NAD(P)-dependent dehydrogenase (short-subunit alcohol dehydrogenase family)